MFIFETGPGTVVAYGEEEKKTRNRKTSRRYNVESNLFVVSTYTILYKWV